MGGPMTQSSRPMSTIAFFLTEGVNALSQAALLFFLGVGLTLIFGIMRIVNFAHGTLYMLGAFIGYSLVRHTGSFWVALALAPIAVGAIGTAFELGILRRLYPGEAHAFLMVTFGLALVTGEDDRLIWGSGALQATTPATRSDDVLMAVDRRRLFGGMCGGWWCVWMKGFGVIVYCLWCSSSSWRAPFGSCSSARGSACSFVRRRKTPKWCTRWEPT